jgi:hypothetical protein
MSAMLLPMFAAVYLSSARAPLSAASVQTARVRINTFALIPLADSETLAASGMKKPLADLLTLARSSRTSVQMIKQFYASNLTAEMNIGLLQSKR